MNRAEKVFIVGPQTIGYYMTVFGDIRVGKGQKVYVMGMRMICQRCGANAHLESEPCDPPRGETFEEFVTSSEFKA